MTSDFKRKWLYFIVVIAIFSMCFICQSGCANGDVKKRKQFEQMSNAGLLSYYHGVNDMIKDIDSQQKIDQESNGYQFEHDPLMNQAIGGKIYELEHKKKLILKELNKRGIYP